MTARRARMRMVGERPSARRAGRGAARLARLAAVLLPLLAGALAAPAPAAAQGTDGPVYVQGRSQVKPSGEQLQLVFDQVLDDLIQHRPSTDRFEVWVNGDEITVTGVRVLRTLSLGFVDLDISPAVRSGQRVTVSYTDPSAGDDTNALQNVDGQDVATFGPREVPNDSEVDGRPPRLRGERSHVGADGTTLTLVFDEALVGADRTPEDAFGVTAGGRRIAVTGYGEAAAATDVVLALHPAVFEGQAVRVRYTDPSAADDTDALQDALGNDVASFGSVAVRNASTETPPRLSRERRPRVGADGRTLTVTFDEPLDAGNPAQPALFEVTVTSRWNMAGTSHGPPRRRYPIAVTGVRYAADGSSVVLDLYPAVRREFFHGSVRLRYFDPPGDNRRVLQDGFGNDVRKFETAVENGSRADFSSPVPSVLFGETLVSRHGKALWIRFVAGGGAFDSEYRAPASAFQVTADGFRIGVTGQELRRISGRSIITLSLAHAIRPGARVEVSYTDPSPDDDLHALQDRSGNDVESFGPLVVRNNQSEVPRTQPAPADFETHAGVPGRIVLSWTRNENEVLPAITGYRIEVSSNGTDWQELVADTGNLLTSWTETGLPALAERWYRVAAINRAGAGAFTAALGVDGWREVRLFGDFVTKVG